MKNMAKLAGKACYTVPLTAVGCLMVVSADGQPVEFRDYPTFNTAAPGVAIETFDQFATQTLLDGSEFTGFALESRRIAVVNPQDFAPGLLVGGNNVNSQPNGVSASIFYNSGGSIVFDNDDDDFVITFDQATSAAGIWVGNVGNSNNDPFTPTIIEFFGHDETLLASEEIRQGGEGMIGSGANNRFFYGLVSDQPIITRITVANAALDGDGIVLDDIQYLPPVLLTADLSGDGDVDDEDLGLFFSAFTGPDNGPSSNPAADLSGDGDVDDEDLGAAFSQFTGPLVLTNVPEPNSLALFALGGLLIARRRY